MLCAPGCAHGVNDGTAGGTREESVDVAKLLLKLAELTGIDSWGVVVDGEAELGGLLFEFALEDLASAGDRVALVIEKALDAEGHLDVATTIEALACAAFVRLELRELALPETEDVGGDFAELGDIADAEVELVRNVRSG
jgi:hypothetical protein